jgi:hypothetical protein
MGRFGLCLSGKTRSLNMKVYQYDAAGYYAGEGDDYGGPWPNNSTSTAPTIQEGFIPSWNGTAWEQVENHQGQEGYLDGRPHTIKDYGPLPAGFGEAPPPPTAAEAARTRRAEIMAELDRIDRASLRPLRAIAKGVATEEDTTKLAELEARAGELRAELAELDPEAAHA